MPLRSAAYACLLNKALDMPNTKDSGWGEVFTGRNGMRLLILAGGEALHAINIYVMATILPSVVCDIGGLDYYAWSTTVFVVASIVGAVLAVRVLEQCGSRGAYRWAVGAFTLGSIICALAFSMPALLIGRTIQGLGSGLLCSFSYAMVQVLFVERLWARVMALVAGAWGIAAMLGPFMGGLFAEAGSWRTSFWSLSLIAIELGLLTEQVFPPQSFSAGRSKSVPFPALRLMLLATAALAVSTASILPSPTWSACSILLAGMLLAGVVRLESTSSHRLLPTGTYHLNSPLGSTYAVIVLLSVATTTEIFLPYLLQTLHGYSPLVAVYITALEAVGWSTASLLLANLKPTMVRRVMLTGPVLMALSMAGLVWLLPDRRMAYGVGLGMLCLLLVLIGAGIGMAWPHLLTKVLTSAQKSEIELASSSITTVQLLATAFGAALTGVIANLAGLTHPGGIAGAASAAQWLFGSFALVSVLALMITAQLLRHHELPLSNSDLRS